MKIATRAAFWEALLELWEKNENIIVLDADLSWSTKTADFAKKFPERFFNMWIAEQDLVWTAAGLSVEWKLPVCASFAIFSTWRAWDQMRNTVCYSKLPVILVGSHAWILTWEDWASHQSLEDIALMRSIPNVRIIQPADAVETKSALEYLINNPGPTYLRTTRAWVYSVNNPDYKFTLWKNIILSDLWSDAAIFATWATVWNSIMAAEKLNEEWIKIKVINISSIKPLDEKNIIQICTTCPNIFTVEDHSITWWIWSAVSEVIAENWIDCKLKRIWMTTFWESWTTEDLYAKYWLNFEWIYNSVKTFLNK